MAKQVISQNAIDIVAELNDKLFEAEWELEQQQRAVSKYRHYLAAEKNYETVMDVRGAIKNLRGKQQRVDELRRSLDKAIDEIFSL